jgi:hypothetical protein
MMIATRRIAPLLLLLAATACASSGRTLDTASQDPFGASGPTTVRIIVQNHNFADARLYYFRRGRRMSLGIVTGKQDGEFVVDWNVPDPMQIEINLLAGPTCRTDTMTVDPGDVLELQIAVVFSQTLGCR